MAEEIELKLTGPAEVLSAVRSHPAVTAVACGRARTQHLSSTYYDTAACDLAAAGVALRLRRAGRRWLQTVKGAGAAAGGLHRRVEFEWPLAAPRLDREKLASTPWRKLFAASRAYRRVFATDVRRYEQPIAFSDGTRAKLCFDVGEIRAGRRRAPVSEIEVELQTGDPSRLFELASALAADLPVRIEPASKAARGYALASQSMPEPRRARDVALVPDSTLASALAALGAECIAQMETNAAAMSTATDAEYLHQLRVGWRRLRALLDLAAPLSSPASVEALEAELGWLGTALGPARDYDVFALQTLPKVAAQFRSEPAIVRLRARAGARRRRARDVARQAVASARLQKLLIGLGAFFTALPHSTAAEASTALRDRAGPVLEKLHARLRKRAKHAQRLAPPERHRARVAAKKLRYTAEFFASLFPARRTEPYVEALSRLQTALGRLNDLEVAARLLDEVAPREHADAGIAYASGVLRGWLAASTGAELKRLREVQRAFRKCEAFWNG